MDDAQKINPLHEAPEPVDHRHGHRQRLRARFRKGGSDSVADYELLELLLFRTIPKRDVKGLAKALLAQFGSIAEVLTAPAARLAEIDGIGEATITDLRIVEAAGRALTKGAIQQREVLGSWSAVIDYCRAAMAFADREMVRILFLDKRNGLLADEVQQTGTVDHTPIYPREVVKRALELSATALIIVHNHPSGDPTPSAEDFKTTQMLVECGNLLRIKVVDHLIIGDGRYVSMQGMGCMQRA